jgi:hypothetical protein
MVLHTLCHELLLFGLLAPFVLAVGYRPPYGQQRRLGDAAATRWPLGTRKARRTGHSRPNKGERRFPVESRCAAFIAKLQLSWSASLET